MATIIGSGLESHLHRQAREKAMNILAEAKDQAEQTVSLAQQEVEQIHNRADARAQAQIVERRRRALAKAQLEAKQRVTRAQEAIMDEVWAQIEARLEGQTSQERAALLRGLIADAARQLGGGALEVHCRADDRERVASTLADVATQLTTEGWPTELALGSEPAPLRGGVLVRRSTGRELVDNSLDERLSLARRELRQAVHGALSK